MKKLFVLLIIVVLSSIFLLSAYSMSVEENKLFCDKNGNFTILVVSDPQCDTKNQWCEARDELEILINRSKPNFVLINGDMNSNNHIPTDMWNFFITPITSRNIYWATTNGNHDPFDKKYYKMYKNYDTCLNGVVSSGDPNFEHTRPMNYVIPVYSNDGQKAVFAIYGMDTGTVNKYGYEGLTKRQINWYKQQSNSLKRLNGGKPLTSLLCMHIPLIQTLDMFYSASDGGIATPKRSGGLYNIYGVTNQSSSGIKNYICKNGTNVKESFIHTTAPKNDRGIFDTILKQGDIKVIIFGHEHQTNFIGSYKGVLLGFAGKLSTGCYSDVFCRGGSVVKFNQDKPQNFTVQWLGSMPSSKDLPAIYSDGTLAQEKRLKE